MAVAVKLLTFGMIAWFGALALLIAIRILKGDIAFDGLLVTERDNVGVNPERVIAMALFPAVLAYYAIQVLHTGAVKNPAGLLSMPDLPETLISLLTGGNGLYLAGKISRRSRGGVS